MELGLDVFGVGEHHRPDFAVSAPAVALAAAEAGHDPNALKLGINTHAFVGDDQSAFAPHFMAMMSRIGRERGWPPMGRDQYLALRSPTGALAAGEPEAVDHREVLRSIERFGTEVAPVVRAEIDRRTAAPR